ncbi:response regulator [Asticcacaulis sp. 201]|uniref:response regulator n=1 Tax=Asticcacaulis sp. 201 TaxID=3028787 RepID=UPI00291669C3|nr:response regulator [Asticcacaulis sp. 201]MDV6329534.1 response regulator [Asticcacaulis sp. 201]
MLATLTRQGRPDRQFAPTAGPVGSVGYASLKVLIVEDNHHMRTIIKTIVQSVGFRDVKEAPDGASAFEILQTFSPDIIFLDAAMTPIDGAEFTRHTRNTAGGNPYVPIIMISGHSSKGQIERARDAGITEYVTKPMTAKALLGRINAVIMRPRPFIKCASYFGPDRRRQKSITHQGPWRRQDDHNEVAFD